MRIEVEQKFVLGGPEMVSQIQDAVRSLHGSWRTLGEQVDSYFAHPARDFSVTDEALRIRRQGELAWITYKGAKLDTSTKTRREIDTPLSDLNAAVNLTEIFEALGFSLVADVRKSRSISRISWQEFEIEVSLDEVPPLGHFVELEIIIVEIVDEESLDAARAAVASLAVELGLTRSERRSYLELLLDT